MLHIVAENGHEAIARLLLDHGADVRVTNMKDETALYLAAEHGHEVIAQLLLDRGVDVRARKLESPYGAAHRGRERARSHRPAAARP